MNTHIGDKISQNTPRRVAKFRKNRPGTSKNLWWEKQIKHGQNITVFAIVIAIAGDCNNCVSTTECRPFKWQMKFNVDKCKVMHVGNRDDGSTYYMEGSAKGI